MRVASGSLKTGYRMGQGLALCKPAGEAYRVKHKKAA